MWRVWRGHGMRSLGARLEQGCDGAAIEFKEDRTILGHLEGSGSIEPCRDGRKIERTRDVFVGPKDRDLSSLFDGTP